MSKIGLWRIIMTFVLMLLVGTLVGFACGGDDEEDTSTASEDAVSTGADTTEAGDTTAAADTTEVEPIESKGKIVLVEQDWDGQLVTTAVTQIILEQEMGYEVELKFAPADSAPMMIGLESGDFHFVCCNWPQFAKALLDEYVRSDNPTVERLGPTGLLGSNGWFVPTYVIEGDADRGIEAVAPDLESYAQLDQYKDVFSTADTGDKGRMIDYVPAWDYRNQDRLDSFGIDFEVVYAGSEAAGFAELDAFYKRGEPILLPLWFPHWSHVKYDLTQIELPAWTEECYPAGTEFNCGWDIDVIAKLVWPGLKNEFPEVYQFFKNLTMTNEQQSEMTFNVTQEGMTPLEAAQIWVDANESVWRPWIP